MKQYEILKRDNLLINFIIDHQGIKNVVSKKTIAEYLTSLGFETSTEYVHSLVRKLINDRKLPICSLNGKGYFWASSKEDIKEAIKHLQTRKTEIEKRIEHLKKFILN